MKGHRWLIVHTINLELKHLKELIEKNIQHSYVEQFVKEPFIDENKLEMLHFIYQDIQIPQYIKEQHMVTIMLVQLALDTHDNIPNHHQEWVMNEREKQLSVLAGDYYSGLYYLLLSEIEEVNMVQIIASAIRHINENKVNLFYNEPASVQELLETIGQIETSLFTKVANYLGHDPRFTKIIEDLLLIKRLNDEQSEGNGVVSTYLANFKKDSNEHVAVNEQLKELIEVKKTQLERHLLQLPYKHTNFKNTILNKVCLSYNISFVEEG